MCGIVGTVGRRDAARLSAMLRVIVHRGPDDEGQSWVDTVGGAIGLGNRRLAILDLSNAGHQPMAAGESVLAYNGEIYNFVELRSQLAADGATFASGTDTEVVLEVLRRYGAAGLARLNGMFGLAFWDAARGELIVARDRFGIKPLYWTERNGELLFASEAKSLFAGGVPAEVNVQAVSAYLSFGWVPGTTTMFDGVSELAPGCLLRWRPGQPVSIERFSDTLPAPDESMTAASGAAELRDRLRDAVRRQMIADVPVGVLLSGGLDSSAIAALAAEETEHAVRAYTIAFRGKDAASEQSGGDDARFARMVAGQLGLELREFEVAPDVTDLLERVAWHLDEPVADPAAMLTLIISDAAASEVKVLLSGQGADELFGGYRVHTYPRVARLVARQPDWLLDAERSASNTLPWLAGRAPVAPGLVLAAHRATDMVLAHAKLSEEERFIAFRSAFYFSEPDLWQLLTPEARAEAMRVDGLGVHRHFFAEHPELSFFDRMLYVDMKTFLVNQNLAYGDRLSMAASIEIADLALAMPERLKIRRLRGKQVLRDAMRGIVPDEVIDRRKAGFGAPIRAWLRGELAPLLADALSDEWLRRTGLFEPAEVRRLIAEHSSNRADHSYRIWTLLSFAIWHRAHIGAAAGSAVNAARQSCP